MTEIPADIRKESERIWREYHSTRLAPYDLPLEISKAINAERERCLGEFALAAYAVSKAIRREA